MVCNLPLSLFLFPSLSTSLSHQPTRKDQAVALLELLLRKDNRAYISFYNSLVKETYDDLANMLHDDLPPAYPDDYKNNSDGCTPYGEKKTYRCFH